jgi:pimeloyl-ACP methyl ester carboxylesterase
MKLVIRTVGTGSRSAALVHGATMSGEVWRDMAAVLLDRYDLTLLLVDQRGHGDSPRSEHYAVADFAADLVENLPSDLDFLIGQSLGGLSCAMASAAVRPKRFIGLDPALAVTGRMAFVLRNIGPYLPRFPDWLLHAFDIPSPGSAPDTLARIRAMWAKWDPAMMHPLADSGKRDPYVVAPPAVPSTLLLADKSFAVPPRTADALRELGWDVRVKPGAVHDLHVQDPHGVVDLLADVLAPARSPRGSCSSQAGCER